MEGGGSSGGRGRVEFVSCAGVCVGNVDPHSDFIEIRLMMISGFY